MSPAIAPRQPFLRWLYTHNPFYVISTACLLYAVRAAYGELEIGAINSWLMMGVMTGYTLVLAGIGVSVIRWGRVWDDARSILLLLLLLFLAISVSMDDLFASRSYAVGTSLMLAGWGLSVGVTEGVFRLTGIRLSLGYRLPMYLLLGLFFVYPWWCSPEMHTRSASAIDWTIWLFPVIAAGLFLLLLPVVRRGQAGFAGHGTPWPWPLFPWTPFGVLAAAVAFRSFVLSMTYGQMGEIWRVIPGSSTRMIAFDVTFGGYFLIPLACSLLILILEAALASRNLALQQRVIYGAWGLLLLAIPVGTNGVFQDFLQRYMAIFGSPVWGTAWLLLAFYLVAAIRRVPHAVESAQAVFVVFTLVGPDTINLSTLTGPHAWPLLILGTWWLVDGLRLGSSRIASGGSASLIAALWLTLPETWGAETRNLLTYHTLWASLIALGIWQRDWWSKRLSEIAAALFPLTAWSIFLLPTLGEVPLLWKGMYSAGLLSVCLLIGWKLRQQRFLLAGLITVAGYGLGGLGLGYYQAVQKFGRGTMTALSWSVGTLLLGVLISAVKAEWIPAQLLNRWLPAPPPPATDLPVAATDGNSSGEIPISP